MGEAANLHPITQTPRDECPREVASLPAPDCHPGEVAHERPLPLIGLGGCEGGDNGQTHARA